MQENSVPSRTVLNLAAWTGIDSKVRKNVSPLTSSHAPFCRNKPIRGSQCLTNWLVMAHCDQAPEHGEPHLRFSMTRRSAPWGLGFA